MKTIFGFLVITLLLLALPLYPQWVQQNLPGDIDVALGIDFIDQNKGVIGGWHTTIIPDIAGNAYYTVNGGTNWVEAVFPDSMRVIVSAQMINENVAYGAGACNITTTNNSKDKFNIYSSYSSQKNEYYSKLGMDFTGQQDYRGYFVETTDGGLSWQPKGSF